MAEALVVRLLLTIPAALGGLLTVALLGRLLRLRHPRLRSLLLGVAIVDTLLALPGLSSLSLILARLVVDPAVLREEARPAAGIVLAIWAAFALMLAARRVIRDRRLRARLRALRMLLPVPEEILGAIRSIARQAGMPVPGLVLIPDDHAPFVVGGRRPVLVFPRPAWDRMDPGSREAAVRHELAHLRRRDPERGLALGVLADLLFFNPVFRALLNRYGRECEALADRLALRLGATRKGLARSLILTLGRPAPCATAAPALGPESTAALNRRLRLLATPPRRTVLVIQVLLLALLLPFSSPGHGGVGLVLERPGPHDRGRVEIGLGLPMSPLLGRLLPRLPVELPQEVVGR